MPWDDKNSISELDDWDNLESSDESVLKDYEVPTNKKNVDTDKNSQNTNKIIEKIEQKTSSKSLLTLKGENSLQKENKKKNAKSGDLVKIKKNEKAEQEEEKNLRSPICCIMGHVDTGKTKLLDKMRQTNIQGGEAGGITQQIGATFFPKKNLLIQCNKLNKKVDMKIPGLLIIDTPGHASFSNLRQRGSSLCDIAILVVDIMHGIERQTLESIQLLKQRKCPFIVALNKIDLVYGWNSKPFSPIKDSLAHQQKSTLLYFKDNARRCILDLTEKAAMNFALFFENKDPRGVVSVVPTSAITGEGIPDLLGLIIQLTQTLMVKKIELDDKNVVASILEVKKEEGLGTCIDVILSAGYLKKGDTIVCCGMNAPIVTTIRALVTPQPLKELRVKSEYIHYDLMRASMGVKIAAQNLENAIAGTCLKVYHPGDNLETLKDEVQAEVSDIFDSIDKSSDGVYVVASTLGSLEALLEFFKESKIPVNNISLGAVHKIDVMKASVMRERGKEEYSIILAFDVKIMPEARKEAAALYVKIYEADIIYNLFDAFQKHMKEFYEQKQRESANLVVYPVLLTMIPDAIFNKTSPMIFGVEVSDGELRLNTPIYCPAKKISLGHIESIEIDKKVLEIATKGMKVAIKLSNDDLEVGKHLAANETLISRITRASIDVLKEYFIEDAKKHYKLIKHLKKILEIP